MEEIPLSEVIQLAQQPCVSRETFTDLEERLRQVHFVRVHRSAIVNVSAIRSIEPISKGDYYVVLRDGTRVRSSRHYRRAVQGLRK